MDRKICILLTLPVVCIFGITAFGQECEQRDVVAAGRACERACSPDGTCRKQTRECVCDGLCGLSCIRKRCPQLPAPLNGNVVNPNGETIGAEVTYSCDDGYVISGQTNRVCQANKTWSATEPTCIESRVEALCSNETIAKGNVTLQDGESITGNALHSVWRHFTCEQGYTIVGEQRSQCLDGEWTSEKPSCVEDTSCPDPGVPGDGIKIGSDYSYDKIVSYECNVRYILEGESSIRCQANGTWNATRPTCRLIQCRRPDEPRNGNSDAHLEYYGQQGTVRFQCDLGYTMRGSRVITCNEHEEWSPPPPLCLGQCRIPSCPSNGRWTINNGGWYSNCRLNRMVDPGCRLTYRCDNDYFKCQQIEPVCSNRVWVPDTHNLCEPLGCNFVTLRDPRLTASYAYSGANECFHPTYHQQETVVEYSCHIGYKIRDGGPSQATCVRRGWVPQQQPVCVEVTCPYIQFPYGVVTYQHNGPFTSNRGHTATAHFFCIKGYRLEGHTISCDNGIWNDTIPRCVEEPCSVAFLEWYNMDIQFEVPLGSTEITAGLKPAGTTANFICRQYGFEASQTKRCERGRWRGGYPVCLRRSCSLPGVSNLVETFVGNDYTPLSEQDIFREGDFTTSRCQNPKAQQLHGSVTRRCEAGEWSGDPSRCDPTNFVFRVGYTIVQNVTENGTIIVYPVRGHVTINCRLTNGVRGIIEMSYDGAQSFQAIRGYNRNSYIINNPSPVDSGRYRCESNGRSHSITILFKAIACPPPSQLNTGTWIHNRSPVNRDGSLGYIFTETVSLICPNGYISSNPRRPKCTHHGTWSNMAQRCVRD